MAIKIFIDQGHNPENPNAGAEGNGYREQDLVYEIGVRLAALLNSNPKFNARLSRNSPDEILGTSVASSLAARVNAANDWGADYFISIHANASDIPTATGTEGFVYSTSSAAYPLAVDIVSGISEATGIPDRGVFARPSLSSAKDQNAVNAYRNGIYHNAVRGGAAQKLAGAFRAGNV